MRYSRTDLQPGATESLIACITSLPERPRRSRPHARPSTRWARTPQALGSSTSAGSPGHRKPPCQCSAASVVRNPHTLAHAAKSFCSNRPPACRFDGRPRIRESGTIPLVAKGQQHPCTLASAYLQPRRCSTAKDASVYLVQHFQSVPFSLLNVIRSVY